MSSQIIICQGCINFHWSSDHLWASSTPFCPQPHHRVRTGSTYAEDELPVQWLHEEKRSKIWIHSRWIFHDCYQSWEGKSFHILWNKYFSFPHGYLHRDRVSHNSWPQNRSCCHHCGFTNSTVTVLVNLHPQQLLVHSSSTWERRLKVPPPAQGSTSTHGDYTIRSIDYKRCDSDNSFCPQQLILRCSYKDSLISITANERKFSLSYALSQSLKYCPEKQDKVERKPFS